MSRCFDPCPNQTAAIHLLFPNPPGKYISARFIDLPKVRAMSNAEKEKFSDEELEEIMDMRTPVDPIRELRAPIRDDPLLIRD